MEKSISFYKVKKERAATMEAMVVEYLFMNGHKICVLAPIEI